MRIRLEAPCGCVFLKLPRLFQTRFSAEKSERVKTLRLIVFLGALCTGLKTSAFEARGVGPVQG